MLRQLFAIVLLPVVVTPLVAGAHHSHANYDLRSWIELEGTVRQVVFIAPHSVVYLDVTDESGDVATWALEAASPAGIFANGVRRDDVRAGDLIKARCHLHRDGSNGCLLGFITPMHGDEARDHGVERHWD
ncbi:MAG: DUF6152 family protein [Gammaproteobacteria bacterium]